MKIDGHVHITPPDIIENWKDYREEEYFYLMSNSPVNKFATAEDVIEELDRNGFQKAVVFGFGFKNMDLCRYVNDYVIESVNRYPDRLIGFMVVNPNSPEMKEEILRCHRAGLKGIGEIFPYGQDFNIRSREAMEELAGLAQELNLPIMIHTNEPVGHFYQGKTDTTPRPACEFAANFPDLKLIFAHWGGGTVFYELMPEIERANKNVYYDTAATPYLYRKEIYKLAEDIGIMDKIIFATDYPLIDIDVYTRDIEALDLRQESKDQLYGENILRFLDKKTLD